MTLELLAWVGTALLAAHSLPQLYKTLTEGHADGLSSAMLLLWLTGAACTLPYVISVLNFPVIAAHTINLIACSVLLKYKFLGSSKMKLIPLKG